MRVDYIILCAVLLAVLIDWLLRWSGGLWYCAACSRIDCQTTAKLLLLCQVHVW